MAEKPLPKHIAQSSCDFYSSLYNLNLDPPSPPRITDYLEASGMPLALSSPVRQELEVLIMLVELQTAVGSAKSGKAPGQDGFMAQYYNLWVPTWSKC